MQPCGVRQALGGWSCGLVGPCRPVLVQLPLASHGSSNRHRFNPQNRFLRKDESDLLDDFDGKPWECSFSD